jgi:hypothetical protein
MSLKPWYRVITPREDLAQGKPLDAAEFAVHLDDVRLGRAPADYQKPERFFDRTYLTRNLTGFAAEVVRRLSGEKTETSAVFNMATAFGGGKTHALTLLYHLATHGEQANRWTGVSKLLERAGIKSIPPANVAVFVGTEFDSIRGRGGDDGTPLRKTPWGEIAFQLGGAESFAHVVQHEADREAPAGDVIRLLFPSDRPCLILIDELMNYVSRNRKSGLSAQFYNFLQNLSEAARGQDNVVVVVSIPSSNALEMTAEDRVDYDRFQKMFDRLGKAVIMAVESETSEIIRRRLFEWDPQAVTQDGRVLLHRDALETCSDYAAWINDHRQQIPTWFPIDHARDTIATTYPFHPMVLSVFERKWQAIPRFQQTRGILRLLALWVSRAYQEGFKGAHRDPLIGLGTAPLDDPLFRTALFEQLGESRLEGAVTTDIIGKSDSFAVRLDSEAVDVIKKARLHRKVATSIFFESNGGTLRAEATVPEVRLAVAEPDLDIGNVETVLETLSTSCYFLLVERNKYRFSLTPNLNKMLSDRRANIAPARIDERIRSEVQKAFGVGAAGVERIYFPERSNQLPDRAVLTLVVLAPENNLQDPRTLPLVEAMTREAGTSGRTFKSALIWAIAEDDATLKEDARKALAWEDIRDEETGLDDIQQQQLAENLKRADRDLKESVWRTYKNLVLLGKDNALRVVDLGLIHSSSVTGGIATLFINRLRQDGDLEESISPNFLVRNWGLTEWSTKSVRDAFFASPKFPRVLKSEVVKDTIARGISTGHFAYVGKAANGEYQPFLYNVSLNPADVEISDDVFIITREAAEVYKKSKETPRPAMPIVDAIKEPGGDYTSTTGDGATPTGVIEVPIPPGKGTPIGDRVTQLMWTGEVPAQKWMNFYTKVLSKFAAGKGLKIKIEVEVSQADGISEQKVEETKVALRELGLEDDVEVQ